MPTARGWLIAAAGVGLWVAGRAFGAGALEQLGFGLLVLVVITVALVRRGRHHIRVGRSVTPARAQAGREVTVALDLYNEGRGASPVLLLEDHLPARLAGRARFALGGIEPEGRRRATYKLRPARRGRYKIGPLEIAVADPFGVARRALLSSGTSSFLVHPRVEQLTMPRDLGRRKAALTSARRQPTGSVGEDFYTLREYVEGDDLRRIHWPATAKRGRYMIRQEETPWHSRALVLLDDRAGTYDDDSWERAIDASASLLDLFHRSGYWFRLHGAIAEGVGSARGSQQLHRCLDLLAEIAMSTPSDDPSDPLQQRLAEIEAQPFAEGSLMLVTGILSVETARALALAARRYKMVAAISILRAAPTSRGAGSAGPQGRSGAGSAGPQGRSGAGSAGPHGTAGPFAEATAILARAGVQHLRLPPGAPLAPAWGATWRAGATGATSEGGERSWERKPARA